MFSGLACSELGNTLKCDLSLVVDIGDSPSEVEHDPVGEKKSPKAELILTGDMIFSSAFCRLSPRSIVGPLISSSPKVVCGREPLGGLVAAWLPLEKGRRA